jgi:hypothetical protein
MRLIFLTGSFVMFCGYFAAARAVTSPIQSLTPGVFCTSESSDFSGYYYDEKIARCDRNVGAAEKKEVAANYNIVSKDDWSEYEFDHLIPLCAGGSNDEENIWPQPIDEAHEKDKIENSVCSEMRAGAMTQAEAVQKIHDWFLQNSKRFRSEKPMLERR